MSGSRQCREEELRRSPGPLIDTNVLCYLFDARYPEKSKIAKELIARCFRSESRYSVSVQNLAEFAVVLSEKIPGPVPYKIISRFISDIEQFEGWDVICYDAGTLSLALEFQKDYRLHFWDALLGATMREQGISTIITEDEHFEKIPWLEVIDPFSR
jgi:predicted nucleic acid-binding protein